MEGQASTFPGQPLRRLSGGKHEHVASLMEMLRIDLEEATLLPQQRSEVLEELKVQSRVADGCDPIYTIESIHTISRIALDSGPSSLSREALRCLANIFLLNPETRQRWVDLGFSVKAAERLKIDNVEDEFLISRILFLMTYDTNLNFEPLLGQHLLAESLNTHIIRHSKRYSKSTRRHSRPLQDDDGALSENVKLIYNIIHYYPGFSDTFTTSIPHLLKILYRRKISEQPLAAPVRYLINLLGCLDLEDQKCCRFTTNPLFPSSDPSCNTIHLITILEKAMDCYPEQELDALAGPVVDILIRIHACAPESVKKQMRALLLPINENKTSPHEASQKLPSRLLQLSTSSWTPNLRNSIQTLMFDLSDQSADTYVQNIGYSFAASFLVTENLAIPTSASEAFSSAGQVKSVQAQKKDGEVPSRTPSLIEDKEREAEKLFRLFERLKRTNTVKARCPVQQAIEQSRWEQVD
ncbi:hypothetical protein M501DRAFT_937485 [Patellaria atrata CBS 101060]|uniref:Uncharacterized protein n=1 Tax=Patellaria atrata CBS 101060 TaxID=1346257 RepID=A0A9P4VLD7_9PEZI|nr:hypothetical protein M501DRAFT_937485 [Patellaria atrata CBS 101060]